MNDANQESDEELLAAFVKGDRAALGELAPRYEIIATWFCERVCRGHAEMACDAVQDTWMRVIRFADQFGERSKFKTWMYRIAINQCRSLQAARRMDETAPLDGEDSRREGPERAAIKAEQNHELRRAVAGLDEDRRLVILLCYHEGMTHEAAAEILGIPLGTLKSRLHAALEELRTKLPAEDRS